MCVWSRSHSLRVLNVATLRLRDLGEGGGGGGDGERMELAMGA